MTAHFGALQVLHARYNTLSPLARRVYDANLAALKDLSVA